MSDNLPSFRAPIFTINATGTATGARGEQPTASSHTGAIAGAAVGSVVAVLLVIGAAVFVRRRKSARAKPLIPFVERSSQSTITPFNPSPLDTTQQGPYSWVEQQRLLPEHPDGRVASDPRSPSPMSSPALPRSRPVAPVPPGLSSKELARLRTEALQTYVQQSSDTTQSSSTLAVSTTQNGAASSSETRRLQSEVDMLRLHIVRFEPPPSYTSRDVV